MARKEVVNTYYKELDDLTKKLSSLISYITNDESLTNDQLDDLLEFIIEIKRRL